MTYSAASLLKNEHTCKNKRIDFDSRRIAMRFLSDNLLAKLSIERLSWGLIPGI